jgi:hypothetical protein
MQMRGNGPWGSTLAPQLCKAFPKEHVGKFWGKLWISIASHGFSIWSWQNSYVLANHTHPLHPIFHLLHLLLSKLWQCKGGVMLQQHKYIPCIYGIEDAKGHLWVWNRKLAIIPTQGTCDCRNMGPMNWPNSYRRWGARGLTNNTRFHWMFCLQFEKNGSIKGTRGWNYIEGWWSNFQETLQA